MTGPVYVLESSTFMRLPEGTDLDAIAAEHGGELIGHFPDGDVVDVKVHAIRAATPEELAEIEEREAASCSWQPQEPGHE
jgi:hypothetical protein